MFRHPLFVLGRGVVWFSASTAFFQELPWQWVKVLKPNHSKLNSFKIQVTKSACNVIIYKCASRDIAQATRIDTIHTISHYPKRRKYIVHVLHRGKLEVIVFTWQTIFLFMIILRSVWQSTKDDKYRLYEHNVECYLGIYAITTIV